MAKPVDELEVTRGGVRLAHATLDALGVPRRVNGQPAAAVGTTLALRVCALPQVMPVPELMGTAEVADEYDVPTSNLRAIGGLPEPVATLRATSLWRASEIRPHAAEFRQRRRKGNG